MLCAEVSFKWHFPSKKVPISSHMRIIALFGILDHYKSLTVSFQRQSSLILHKSYTEKTTEVLNVITSHVRNVWRNYINLKTKMFLVKFQTYVIKNWLAPPGWRWREALITLESLYTHKWVSLLYPSFIKYCFFGMCLTAPKTFLCKDSKRSIVKYSFNIKFVTVYSIQKWQTCLLKKKKSKKTITSKT